MSFCQICREELPGHQMGCPVLTGESVQGVQWITQALPQGPGQQAMGFNENQFLLDYTRRRVLELQEYHIRKSAEALAREDFTSYSYHEGARSVVVTMVAILLNESHVLPPNSPQEGV
jgi:hypothetical protein